MTDTAELIERLRDTRMVIAWGIRQEAAAALETLQAENERLCEAVQQAIYDLGIPHAWPVGDERWKAYRTLTAALAAINALPAVTVTDDMVERAARALMYADDLDPDVFIGMHKSLGHYGDTARKALEAALPDAPCKE